MIYEYDLSPFRGFNPFLNFDSEPYTAKVPYSSSPNGYGLYDVSGNIAEFCWDFYGELALEEGVEDPGGTDTVQDLLHDGHVVRGGSWQDLAPSLQTSARGPGGQGLYTGFRFAMRAPSGRFRSAPAMIDLRSRIFSIHPDTVHGSINGAGSYALNETVAVSAVPSPGYLFSQWTGDLTGTVNPSSVTMDADKQIGAVFVADLADDDGDGLSNHREIVEMGSDPSKADTDRDGLSDGDEALIHGSNPLNADTDGDGLNDRVEVIVHRTNPASADTDGDGFDDSSEIFIGFDPLSSQSTPETQSTLRMAVQFRFYAADGVGYRIESSSDLVQWISAALHPSSPYSHSPWRQDDGMVWDVGPHVLSQLIFVLGPIKWCVIDSVEDDGLVSVAFHHESGATSSARMTARALPEQKEEWMTLTGPAGEALCPAEPMDFVTAHQNSVSALMAQISGAPVDPHELSSLPRSVEMVQALSLLDTAIKNGVVGHIISLEGP
jgi:hypothetical protein